MKASRVAMAVSALMGGVCITPAEALDLYVDVKTNQVYTVPGPHRVKLGAFKQVDEMAGEMAAEAPAQVASVDDVKKVESKLNQKIDAIANKPKKPNESKGTIDGKGIRWETNDGKFKFSINGRLHTDANLNSGGDIITYNDNSNTGTFEPGDPITQNRLTDGTEIRRFRMEFAGQFYDDFLWKMQPEIANAGGDGTIGIRDAFIQYTGFDWGKWTLGQSKQPFSYQQMMSSNDMPFMERSLEYEFTNRSVNRAVGIRYDIGGEQWGFGVGWYGDTATRQASGTTAADDEGWGAAARLTAAPIYTPDTLLHVGTSVAYRAPRSGDPNIRYRIAPSAIDHVNYLDTGNLKGYENSQFFNAEATGAWGPLSFEGEYNATWLNRDSGYDDGFLSGYHFDLIYSLTGESRAAFYNAEQGVIRKLRPNQNFDLAGGWGAWELKGRIMYVDMNNVGDPGNTGGRELASTFGVNWHWNDWARLLVDWTHVWNLDVGAASVRRAQLCCIPGNNTGGWDQVSARVSLAY
ncbi:hypothetical protein EWI61_11045 [Methylolobus aquaticus]|nr:hypothetical protein EWI61_11045 [Methylolobus aquaticus]